MRWPRPEARPKGLKKKKKGEELLCRLSFVIFPLHSRFTLLLIPRLPRLILAHRPSLSWLLSGLSSTEACALQTLVHAASDICPSAPWPPQAAVVHPDISIVSMRTSSLSSKENPKNLRLLPPLSLVQRPRLVWNNWINCRIHALLSS